MSRTHYRIAYNHDGGTLLRPFHPFTGVPIADDAEKAHGVGCPLYLSLKVEAAFQQLAYSREAFRAAAAYAYQAGADGIHLFNMNALRDSHDYGLGADYDFALLRG